MTRAVPGIYLSKQRRIAILCISATGLPKWSVPAGPSVPRPAELDPGLDRLAPHRSALAWVVGAASVPPRCQVCHGLRLACATAHHNCQAKPANHGLCFASTGEPTSTELVAVSQTVKQMEERIGLLAEVHRCSR